MVTPAPVRIASRGSDLALWQARAVEAALRAADPSADVEIRVIKTTGDNILDVPLAKIGDKGLFTNELDHALLTGAAELAVHSLKDVPTRVPDGLEIVAVSRREDPRDVLIVRGGGAGSLAELPAGAKVGTSSLRRRAQLRAARPDLEVADLRGNLNTRMAKLDRGDYDAVILAAAGVLRLGWEPRIAAYLDPAEWLPAVGQGALGVVTRSGDERIAALRAGGRVPGAVRRAGDGGRRGADAARPGRGPRRRARPPRLRLPRRRGGGDGVAGRRRRGGARARRAAGGAGRRRRARARSRRGAGGPRARRAVTDPATKVLSRADLLARLARPRSGRLVFTNGVFDVLHRGHVDYLARARALGDALVVAVNSDASVRRLGKGADRPVNPEDDRAYVVAGLEAVDWVTVFDEDTPRELVAALLPDVLVKGGDYTRDTIVGAEEVEAAGGRVEVIPLVPGRSTTQILQRVRQGAEHG